MPEGYFWALAAAGAFTKLATTCAAGFASH